MKFEPTVYKNTFQDFSSKLTERKLSTAPNKFPIMINQFYKNSEKN